MASKGKLKKKATASMARQIRSRSNEEAARNFQDQTYTDIRSGEPGAADMSTDDPDFRSAMSAMKESSLNDPTNQFFDELNKEQIIQRLMQLPSVNQK